MTTSLDLLKAIRTGRLQDVCAALDAGIPLDADGESGFSMGMACFLGHVGIVRELVARGGQVNLEDNTLPTSPLSMAVRGGKTEVVRALLELGAQLPEGMQTGLSEQEITVAQWIAFRDGRGNQEGAAAAHAEMVEEIEVHRHSHTDTQVLESELMRAIRESH